MDASNFIFNGRSLSDFGFIMCQFDGETNTVSPADIVYTSVKVPGSDRNRFVSSSYDEVISFEFSIVQYDCRNGAGTIDRFLDSAVRRWLCLENGYKELVIETKDFDDIYFFAKIGITPHIAAGKIRGYRLTVTTDSPYGYSERTENEFDVSPSAPYKFYASSDRAGYFYPVWEITPRQDGNLYLKVVEDTNQTNTVFHSVSRNKKIIIDSENGIVEGTDPDNFNWIIPRIVQDYEYNFNTITSTLPCRIKLIYRTARKAVC